MNASTISLSGYLSAPAEAVALSRFPAEAASCFVPFLSARFVPGLLKWSAVQTVRNALVDKGCVAPFSVHLLWKWETLAYMDDAGKVFLSAGLLHKSGLVPVLAVYCHELSHIKLSQQPDYPAIKALQREFKQRFQDHKLCELLSPIEYYAMRISQSLMAQIAEQTQHAGVKEKLLQAKADLDQKILLLDRELCKLAQNNVP